MSDQEQDKEQMNLNVDSVGDIPSEDMPADTDFIAEGKKPLNRGMLVLFGIILTGAIGVYLMYLRTGPATAGAATTDESAAHQTIQQFLSDSGNNMKVMEQMLRNTEKVVQQFLSYPSATQVPIEDLHTNPFRHWTPKLDSGPTDEYSTKLRHEEQRAAARRAVQALQLQSIVHSGQTRACMINNALYSEGQQIDEFLVERINPDSVIVKKSVFRFELKMQK